ncbi:MAG: hypothetical protein IJI58_02060 [Bacilli bacterium]|nr:hypothetical protein [Bacilli bacterium]
MEYVYEKPADEKLYEEMRRKSLQGEPVKRPRKRIRINKKVVARNFAILMTIITLTASVGQLSSSMREKIRENALYNQYFEDYMDEVFHQATHHVDGTVNDFYLDYEMLGNYIDNADDKDLAISLTQRAIESKNLTDDEDQMDRVLAETDLGVDSYDQYLSQKEEYAGYQDKDKFVEDTKKKTNEQASKSDTDQMLEKDEETKVESGGKNL